jgi:hypothetical protein
MQQHKEGCVGRHTTPHNVATTMVTLSSSKTMTRT